jgi:hypothetical protein
VAKVNIQSRVATGKMSLQETLTSLPNIVLLSTGNKATIAVVHHQIINANFVRLGDLSLKIFALYFLMIFSWRITEKSQ